MCRCRSSPSPLRGALQSDCVKEKAGSCAGGKPLRNKCFGRRELTTLFFCTGCWGLAKTPPRPLRGALQKVAGRGTFRGTARGRNKCFRRRELTTLLFLYGMLETRDFKNSSAAAPRRCSREWRDAENSAEPRGEASRRPWRPHDVCACRRAGGRTMRNLPCGWEAPNEDRGPK